MNKTEIEALGKVLFNFFMWFRENGETHLDKSIEKMIEVYMNEQALSDYNNLNK
jgi:hypothetical protein